MSPTGAGAAGRCAAWFGGLLRACVATATIGGCPDLFPPANENDNLNGANTNVNGNANDNGADNKNENGSGRPTPRASVVSRFDEDDEGWRVQGGPFPGLTAPNWSALGGSPDGAVAATGSQNWYWVAPSAFRGNLSTAYGRTLSFDLNRDSDACAVNIAERVVVIEGGGYALYYTAPYGPDKAWTHYRVSFDASEPWYHSSTNTRATEAELRAALRSVGQLRIRGWFNTCADPGTGGLDNVVLDLDGFNLPAPDTGIASDFDEDDEDWTVAGGDLGRLGTVEWSAADGSPAGHARAASSANWYWIAPAKFRGDLAAAYGGRLEFDLNRSSDVCYANEAAGLIVLEGGGHSIFFNAAYAPGFAWTHFSVGLRETEQWFDRSTGLRVTEDQMRDVLGSLGQLRIRGWFNTCNAAGFGGLDNVQLRLAGETPPAPTGAAVEATFDDDAEGWTVAGGSMGQAGVVNWSADGGSDAGGISAAGSGGWYWMAPPAFRGDLSAAYGQRLSFDLLRDSAACPSTIAAFAVIIQGGGYAIYTSAAHGPQTTWTSFSFDLDAAGGWSHFPDGRAVNEAELRAVLGNVGQLLIRGWYNSCSAAGTGSLDQVRVELGE